MTSDERLQYYRQYNKTRRKELRDQRRNGPQPNTTDRILNDKQKVGTDEYFAAKHTKRRTKYARQYRIKKRILAMERLCGNKSARCSCCGETEHVFLQIHHSDGDGQEDRVRFNRPLNFYKWIVNATDEDLYSARLMVLCANCHLAITILGYCPKHGKEQK